MDSNLGGKSFSSPQTIADLDHGNRMLIILRPVKENVVMPPLRSETMAEHSICLLPRLDASINLKDIVPLLRPCIVNTKHDKKKKIKNQFLLFYTSEI